MFYAKISSGLDFLDASIGGLYSNRCYLLRGPAHSGRTTMVLQFLLSGLEQGENGIMISSDRIENVILRAEAMGFSLEQYLLDNKLILMEYPQDISNRNFHYGGIVALLGEIEQYMQLYNCNRLAVDTLLPLLIRPREPHFVNFIYSLMNAFDEMQVTTIVTTGEPNSPNALRIIQLMEDAVVGSFSLSNHQTSLGEDRRSFTVHKMINPINPPTTFKVQIEYGLGLTQDIPTMDSPYQALPAAQIRTKAITDLPLNIVLLDNDEDTLFQIEEIFPKHNNISVYTTEEEFAMHLYGLDCDLLLLNANQTTLNWRQILDLLRNAYPTLPMFLLTDGRQEQLTYQAAMKVGANGLFFKPLVPDDIRKAFEKAVKEYGTMDELLEKRGAVLQPQSLPEDFADPMISTISGGKTEDVNIISLADFKDKIMMQIWKYNQQQTSFNLISFKMVYLRHAGNLSNLPQGMELVKRVGIGVINSLRSLNDMACRHMDKIVVLLENSTKEGAVSFAKRVVADLNVSLSTELNLQPNRHFHILTAVTTYPDDADNVNDLMSQVTDVSRNLVRSI